MTAPLDFRFRQTIDIAPGSAEQATLRNVMQPTAEEEASDVYFELKTAGRGGKVNQIGQGFLNLKQLKSQGRDFTSMSVTLQGSSGSAGTLKVSLLALEALRALDASDNERERGRSTASRFVAGTPATTRGSTYGRGAPTQGPSQPGVLEVEVGAMTISSQLRNNIDVSELWVDVFLVGIGMQIEGISSYVVR